MLTVCDARSRRFAARIALRVALMPMLAGFVLASLAFAGSAFAHDGHSHAKPKPKTHASTEKTKIDANRAAPPLEAANGAVATAASSGQFLGGQIGGDFDLTDQYDNRRRRADFAGRNVLLFFGYAQCESICSAAIPLMSQVLDRLGERGKAIDLVLITVDPERDTPEGLRDGLAKYDPRFIGLTGTREALEPVWNAFQISTKEVSRDSHGQPVFAHGSFIYLLGPQGEVKTLLPPVLSPERIQAIVQSYLPRLD
jgi:protein SCO1